MGKGDSAEARSDSSTVAAFVVLFGFLAVLLGVAVIALGRMPEPASSSTSSASGAPGFTGRVGVNGLDFFAPTEAPDDLARLSDAGLGLLRENFYWDDLEPAPGRFDWSQGDALMRQASRTGVDVLAILDYSAEWASSAPEGDPEPLLYPPSDPADFARFAGAVAERYGPGGTFWVEHPRLDPAPVTAVELWNEPWLDVFWLPRADAAGYARLAVAAARAVRESSPDVKILIDGSATDRVGGAPWIRQVLQAEPRLGDLVDAYSVHPYTEPRDLNPLEVTGDRRFDFDQIELTREETTRAGAAHPLWVTEVGWSTATDASGALLDGAVDEATQAQYLRDAVERALTEWDYVERVYVYTDSRDEPLPAGDSLEGYFGLRRADGTPKPAWQALVTLLSS